MYSITTIIDGIKYTVCFFASFTGMTHPYTPIDPLELDQIHMGLDKYDDVPYYQGWYSESEKGQRLQRFYKFLLLKSKMELNFNVETVPGVYYHRLEKVNGDWLVNDSILPEEILNQKHYLRYVVNEKGELVLADHIYSSLKASYFYTYSKNGAMKNVDSKAYETPTGIPDL